MSECLELQELAKEVEKAEERLREKPNSLPRKLRASFAREKLKAAIQELAKG